MTCSNPINERGSTCGSDGELCDECLLVQMREHAWLARASKYTVMPIDEAYYDELRDAGRIA